MRKNNDLFEYVFRSLLAKFPHSFDNENNKIFKEGIKDDRRKKRSTESQPRKRR